MQFAIDSQGAWYMAVQVGGFILVNTVGGASARNTIGEELVGLAVPIHGEHRLQLGADLTFDDVANVGIDGDLILKDSPFDPVAAGAQGSLDAIFGRFEWRHRFRLSRRRHGESLLA